MLCADSCAPSFWGGLSASMGVVLPTEVSNDHRCYPSQDEIHEPFCRLIFCLFGWSCFGFRFARILAGRGGLRALLMYGVS